jgi:hypothetical protein
MAHCYDRAVFAAAALARHGDRPLVVNLFPSTQNDDEHLLAVYRRHGAWGAVAKSNFAGLRFREPIYRTLRELVISYFEQYYNVTGEKTLRSYTRPLNPECLDRYEWLARDETMDRIALRLDGMHRTNLLTPSMIAGLAPIDERSYRAGLAGADVAGLYRPPWAASRDSLAAHPESVVFSPYPLGPAPSPPVGPRRRGDRRRAAS